MAGLTADVNVSTGDSASRINAVAQAAKQLSQFLKDVAPALTTLDGALGNNAKQISNALTIYTKAANLAGAWAKATLAAAEAEKTEASASTQLTAALQGTQAAVAGLVGISKQSYDAKSRTLALSQQQINVDKTAAESIKLLAQAENEEAKAALARAKAGVTTNGAPLSAQQADVIARRDAAAAAKQAAAAQDALTQATARQTQAASAQRAGETENIRMLLDAARAAQGVITAQDAQAAATARAAAAAAAATAELRKMSEQQALAAAAAEKAARAQELLASQQALWTNGAARATTSTNEFAKANEQQTTKLQGSYFAMYQVAAAYGVLAAAAEKAVTAPISVAASYQNAFAQVQRVVGDGTESLDQMSPKLQVIRDQLEQLSTVIPTSFEGLSGIATLAGQLGIATGSISSFTQTVAQFSALTNVNAQDATLAFGQIDNLLGVASDKYANVASAVAELGASSAATESQILGVTTQIAAASHQAGYTTEDVLGLATAFASLKISPDLAKGAVTRIFATITRDVNAGGEALKPYADLLGITSDKAAELQRQNPAAFFNDLIRGMAGATAAGKDLTTITDDLGIKNTRDVAVIQRLAGNYGLLAQSNLQAYSAFQSSSYLATSSSLIFGTLTNQVTETKNAFSNFLDGVGGPALKPLQGLLFLVDNVIHAFSLLPSYITAPIVALTALVAAFAAFKATTAIALAGTLAFQAALGTSGAGTTVSLASLRTALTTTFGSGAASARAAAAVIVPSELAMTDATRLATAEYSRRSAVMAAAEVSLNSAAVSEERLAAITLTASAATKTQIAQMNFLAADVLATGNATSALQLRTELLTTAQLLEAQASEAQVAAHAAEAAGLDILTINTATFTAETNLAAASQLRSAESSIAAAGGMTSFAVAEGTAATASKVLGISLGGWIGIAAGVIAVGVGIFAAFSSQSDAAKKAQEAIDEYSSRVLAAAGGQDALQAAVDKDTAAFQAAGEKATAANGVFEVYGRSIDDLGNRTARVNDVFQSVKPGQGFDEVTAKTTEADKAMGNTSITVGNFNSVADIAKQKAEAAAQGLTTLASAAGINADEINRSSVALGANVKALEDKAIADVIYGQDGKDPLISPDVRKNLEGAGVQMTSIINAAISGKAGAVNAVIQPYITTLQNALNQAEDAWNHMDYGKKNALSPEARKVYTDTISDLHNEIDALNTVGTTLDSTGAATRDQVTNLNEMKTTLDALDPSLKDTSADTSATGDAMDTASTAGIQFKNTLLDIANTATPVVGELDALGSRLTTVYGAAFNVSDAVGAVDAALRKLGTGLATSLDFSNFTDAGQTNLANLKGVIDAYSAQEAEAVKTGEISAQQGADNVSRYITNLVNSLATKGVDTHQLDFLVNYVQAVTSNPAVWSISTDVSQGISNLTALANYAAQIQNLISNLDASNSRNTSDQANRGLAPAPIPTTVVPGFGGAVRDPSAVVDAAAALEKQRQEAAAYATALAAAKATDEAATQAATAQRQAQSQANQEAKQGATDAKNASQDAANAASDAAEKIQKQQQYVKDLGSYYAGLGSDILGLSTQTGKVVDGLTSLGTSIQTNGVSFSAFSAGGRANLSALGDALDNYGSVLSSKLESGSISADQAGKDFKTYAGGVRQDLLSLGVPANQINAYFKALGAGSGWQSASKDIKQYSGLILQAGKDSTTGGDQAIKVLDGVAMSAKDAATYLTSIDDYFKSLTDNAFKFVKAEGDVYAGLQALGQSIADNGKGFSTLTEAGRKNFDALSTVVGNFETDLSDRVKAGLISSKQAAADLASFSGGVYNELLRLGVKAGDIAPILKSLGLNTSGWNAGSAAVKQYSGVLTAAEKAALAATKSVAGLTAAQSAAADYASRLATALTNTFDKLHNMRDATDATTRAEQALVQTHADNIQKVKDLTAANADLKSGMAQDQTEIENFNRQIAIAQRYGQTDKVNSLTAQRDAVQTDLTDKKGTTKTNQQQIDEINKYGNSLSGNTKEALANRTAYEGLEKTMLDQIDAYAKTGKSTKQVADYTAELKKRFIETGLQAGYSKGDIKKYSADFDAYADTVRSIPTSVATKVTATADTNAALSALGSIPTSGNFQTTAFADTTAARKQIGAIPTAGRYALAATPPNITPTIQAINRIPKIGSYQITPRVSTAGGGVAGVLSRAGLPGGGTYKVTAAVDKLNLERAKKQVKMGFGIANVAINTFLNALGLKLSGSVTAPGLNITKGISTPTISSSGVIKSGAGTVLFNHGGTVGMSNGGLVPGTPPANPNADNVPAISQTGRPLMLRSREFVQPEPAVDYYGLTMMNAIRNRTFPRMTQGFAGGGSIGGGSLQGYTGTGSPVIVALSIEDRRMLSAALNRPVVAAIDGQRLDTIQRNKQAAARLAGVS